jgi:SAM-dependent methyltransferase
MTDGLRRDELIAAQYFAAVAGLAALRHCLTEPSTVRARLDDVAGVVARLDEFPNDLRIPVIEHTVDDGYAAWADRYDAGPRPNPATIADDEALAPLLAGLPAGARVLDAACGTGRHAATLAAAGHEVVGVDASEAMLAVAAAKLPGADLRLGRLDDLPLDDGEVDAVVCSLALTHVAELEPVLAELARVLRPGGTAILSDLYPVTVLLGGTATFPGDGPGFELPYVPNLLHPVSEYVAAALAAGFAIRSCAEPAMPELAITGNPAYPVVPDAVRQAYEGMPFLLVWELER